MGWVLDMWRGYSDSDLLSLEKKLMDVHPPGSIIELSYREYRAYMDVLRHSDQRDLQSENDPC